MTDFDIRKLDPGDVDAVDRLMKANSATLGFLPREALLAYLRKGRVLGVECPDGSLAAYILFANRARDVRVAHVCVCREFRGKGLARKLMERSDELNLKITDETLVEIDRDDDDERRNRSRQAALGFPKVSYDDQSFRQIESVLGKVLPTASDNDRSDIKQLAKAAASDATYFATRDKKLLGRREPVTRAPRQRLRRQYREDEPCRDSEAARPQQCAKPVMPAGCG